MPEVEFDLLTCPSCGTVQGVKQAVVLGGLAVIVIGLLILIAIGGRPTSTTPSASNSVTETRGSADDRTRYERDVRDCGRKYQDVDSTSFATLVTRCLENLGHDMSFVRRQN